MDSKGDTAAALLRAVGKGALALLSVLGLAASGAAHAIPPEAQYVGEKVCVKCHDVEARHFSGTRHAKIFRENPKTELEARVCEACHGPGSLHVPRDDHKIRENL